jgi:endonuclease YncB( thermonuclease family)
MASLFPTSRDVRIARRRWRIRLRKAALLLAVGMVIAGVILGDRAGLFGRRQAADYARYHGKTVRCVNSVDGDTLDLALADHDQPRTRVRLWGVDTPETVRPNYPVEHFGPEASKFTLRATHNVPVGVELLAHKTRDKYGRLLAYITLPDGTDLAAELIRRGLGYADTRFKHPRRREYIDLMKQAIHQRRGLWAKPRPDHWPEYLLREGSPVRTRLLEIKSNQQNPPF